jgi:Cu+-exporting ATPase
MLSGEPIPVDKVEGERVTTGTINITGSCIISAREIGSSTVLARIIQAVNEGQRSRLPLQKDVDKVAEYFVPAVITISVATFAYWFFVAHSITSAVMNAIAVLIVACPCALGLAAPMSVIAAVGRGAASGLLIRNAEVLQGLAKVDTLVVDKTGTVTEGKPTLLKTVVLKGSESEALRIAASLEQGSEHPLAHAILKRFKDERKEAKAGKENEQSFLTVTDFKALTGFGVTAKIDGVEYFLGRSADETATTSDIGASGATLMQLKADGEPIAIFAAGDKLKESAKKAAQAIQARGIRLIMLSGDQKEAVEYVAAQAGISEARSGLQPTEKASYIKALQAEKRIVAMAGDGINDAPALSVADVGIAMDTGSDIALESAGIVLVNGDLKGLERAITLSNLLISNIRQNLFLAFIYNTLAIPLAAGALYPSFGILLNPMLASALMSLSSVSVIANSLRLQKSKLSAE